MEKENGEVEVLFIQKGRIESHNVYIHTIQRRDPPKDLTTLTFRLLTKTRYYPTWRRTMPFLHMKRVVSSGSYPTSSPAWLSVGVRGRQLPCPCSPSAGFRIFKMFLNTSSRTLNPRMITGVLFKITYIQSMSRMNIALVLTQHRSRSSPRRPPLQFNPLFASTLIMIRRV